MAIVCGISGVPPQEAVLTPGGHIFERRLIEKHIDTTGLCPITQSPINKDDLRPIKVANVIKPRPASATSIPGLLSLFQSEWDSIVGETFALKTQLDNVRQQLSHALYQYDAATRVVGRLLKERDAASGKLAALENQIATARLAQPELGISDELIEEISTLAKHLLGERRKRVTPPLMPISTLSQTKEIGSYSFHGISIPGVKCVRIHPRKNEYNLTTGTTPIIITGGMDGAVCVFDMEKGKVLAKLQGHMKNITDIALSLREEVIISSAADKTIRIWKGDDDYNYMCAHTIRRPESPINSVAMHPIQSHIADAAANSSWAFHDILVGRTLKVYRDLPTEYGCIRFHPDGLIMAGAGQDGQIYIWDTKAMQQRTSLAGHTGPITRLAFSENGYYLATSSLDGTIKMWDLRKSLSFMTLQSEKLQPANAVAFDMSGHYLATAAADIGIYMLEGRSNFVHAITLDSHENIVTDIDVGINGSFFVSSSMDRTVKFYAPPKESAINDGES